MTLENFTSFEALMRHIYFRKKAKELKKCQLCARARVLFSSPARLSFPNLKVLYLLYFWKKIARQIFRDVWGQKRVT